MYESLCSFKMSVEAFSQYPKPCVPFNKIKIPKWQPVNIKNIFNCFYFVMNLKLFMYIYVLNYLYYCYSIGETMLCRKCLFLKPM